MHRILALSLLSAVGSCGREPSERVLVDQQTCGWTDSTRIGPKGIGDLRIGMSLADVTQRCAVIRDTIEYGEGQPQRFVYVRIGGAVAYVEIAKDSVWRMGTRDSLLRTVDGLGAGTAVRTLLASDPAWVAHGEGVVAVGLRRHCGLSFLLAPMFTAPGRPLFLRRVDDLRKAAPETAVVEVLVVTPGHCG